MADRSIYGSSFGHPGRLEYIPLGVPQAEKCGWQTARNHDQDDSPSFRELGPRHEWFEPSQIPVSASSQDSWHQLQNQKIWLLKNHPEAALGNDIVGGILSEEISSPYRSDNVPSWRLTQLAVGQITDTSDSRGVSSAPLIAMAAGSAGDVLRLVRPSEDYWQLGNEASIKLQLYDCHGQQETLWTEDIGTIRRIQPVVNTKRYEPVRWLIVQREAGTSVFAPEYQNVPVISNVFPGTEPHPPSHVAPNLLFTLSKQKTGYASHSDAAYNPAATKKPPQLAVIDEAGRWSIWDIIGSRRRTNRHHNVKISLSECGTLLKGVRTRLSHKRAANLQWHRVFWIGDSTGGPDDFEDSDDEEDSGLQSHPAFPPLQRSSTLLLCNSNRLRILDLETKTFLTDLPVIPKGSKETILDVHDNPHGPCYFFVVTTSKLLVIGLFSTDDITQKMSEKHASILHTSPHARNNVGVNLKMTVTPGPRSPKYRTSFVFLYSTDTSWVDIFCLRMSKKHPEQVTCHRDTMTLGAFMETCTNLSLQTLCLRPAPITVQPDEATTERVHSCLNQQMRYYQLFTLGADLRLSCSLGVSSIDVWDQEMLPSQKIDNRPVSRGNHERSRVIRHLASRFVIHDNLAEFRYGGHDVETTPMSNPTMRADKRLRFLRPLFEQFERAFRGILEINSGGPLDMDIFGAAPFDSIYVAVETALERKVYPLKTLREIIQRIRIPENISELSDEWQTEIEQLQHVNPAIHVMSLAKRQGSFEDMPGLRDLGRNIANKFIDMDDISDGFNHVDEIQELSICHTACDVYLSLHGVMYRQPVAVDSQPSMPLDASSPATMSDDMMIIDSQPSRSRQTPISPGSLSPSVSAMSVTSDALQDTALALIQAYTSTGKSEAPKPNKLLGQWTCGEKPSIRMEETTEITPGMQRLEKQLAKAARKRKRAETLDQLRRDHGLLPATQPAAATGRFFSSQVSQPLGEVSQNRNRVPSSPLREAMSQPLAGAFGGRRSSMGPQKKRVKRKGGF